MKPAPFRWFAWRPVWTFDRGWVWLRPVWRQHVPPKDIPGVPTCWVWDHWVDTPTESRPVDLVATRKRLQERRVEFKALRGDKPGDRI